MTQIDETEGIRRIQQAQHNADPSPREEMEAKYGQVWDTDQLQEDFEVLGFMAPLLVVRRKRDGQKGSLYFRHHPRLYYQFEPHTGN